MRRAVELAAAVRTHDVAQPVGRRRARDRRRAHVSRAPPSRPAGPTPRSSPSTPPARRADPRAPPSYVTLEPCAPPRPHRPPCADAARRRRRRPGRRRRSRTPTRRSPGRGIDRLRDAGVDVDGRRRPPTRSPTSSRPTSRTAAPAGPTSCSSWPPPSTAAPRRPTARSRWITGPRRPGRRPPPAGRERRRPRRRRHRAGRRPRAHRPPRRRAATRCGSCSARRPPGARVHPCLELDGDLGDVLDELGGRGVAPGAGRGRRHRGRRLPPGRPRRPLRRSTWRRRCSAATTPAALFAGAGAATIDDVWRGRIADVDAASATTSASTWSHRKRA